MRFLEINSGQSKSNGRHSARCHHQFCPQVPASFALWPVASENWLKRLQRRGHHGSGDSRCFWLRSYLAVPDIIGNKTKQFVCAPCSKFTCKFTVMTRGSAGPGCWGRIGSDGTRLGWDTSSRDFKLQHAIVWHLRSVFQLSERLELNYKLDQNIWGMKTEYLSSFALSSRSIPVVFGFIVRLDDDCSIEGSELGWRSVDSRCLQTLPFLFLNQCEQQAKNSPEKRISCHVCSALGMFSLTAEQDWGTDFFWMTGKPLIKISRVLDSTSLRAVDQHRQWGFIEKHKWKANANKHMPAPINQFSIGRVVSTASSPWFMTCAVAIEGRAALACLMKRAQIHCNHVNWQSHVVLLPWYLRLSSVYPNRFSLAKSEFTFALLSSEVSVKHFNKSRGEMDCFNKIFTFCLKANKAVSELNTFQM